MEELVVTRFWMAGVMAVMLAYGFIAVVGLLKARSSNEFESTSKNIEE